MRERLVQRDLNPLLATLPEKFVDIPDYQVDAVMDIVEAFLDESYRVVVLDAPTGSGKTLIAECVRRILGSRAVYVCHNKDLQAQFAGDFRYASVLYGRNNYTPHNPVDGATCGDCQYTPRNKSCGLCFDHDTCPYQVAKRKAVGSPVPILNSSYWLNEVQSPNSRFANTGLVVFDEVDTLEKVLMDQVEVYIGARTQTAYGIRPPRKLTVVSEYLPWTDHVLDQIEKPLKKLTDIDFASVQQTRELKKLVGLMESVNAMRADLENELPWVYTGGAGGRRRQGDAIAFKPVKVDRFGASRIWQKDKRFLLMSGTIVSPDQLVRDLGYDGAYRFVSVDSQFHPRNRQVVVRAVADMSRKGDSDVGRDRMRSAVSDALRRHAGERGVVHSVSYSLSAMLADCCKAERPGAVFSYTSALERSRAIERFKQTPGSVLVAPSADRGVDLPNELCRFQIIAKVPYLSLGDKQVQERLYKTPDGKVWYNVHVARTIMQMVGRGVRNNDDYCVTYVFDSQFKNWYRAWGHLLPKWFKKGLRFE